MRFMVMIKATPQTEAGEMPSEDVLTAMGRYNEELANAGVLLGGEGLHPSHTGARVRFSDGRCSVTDGTVAEPSALLAASWLFQPDHFQEAHDRAKCCPHS